MELRATEIPNVRNTARPHIWANGYFNDPLKLLEATRHRDYRTAALSFTVNPVRRSLLQAANNKWRRPAGWTARDNDITRRNTLLVRFISEDKDQTAQDQAEQCRRFLRAQGWPEAIVADSGTG